MEKIKIISIKTKPLEGKAAGGILGLRLRYAKALAGLIKKQDILRAGIAAAELELPLYLQDFLGLGEEAVVRLWRQVCRQIDLTAGEDRPALLLEEGLRDHIRDGRVIDGQILPELYINRLIDLAARERQIPRKDIDILLIDGGQDYLGEVLQRIYPDRNALSLLTGRPDYFEAQIEQIYEETGLMIARAGDRIRCNVILDFSDGRRLPKSLFMQPAAYLDFCPDKQKIRMLRAKGRSLSYHQDFQFSLAGESIESRFIQAAVYGEATAVMRRELSCWQEDKRIELVGFLKSRA